ncbi:MAG: excinuclease ABC subunit UvrC [Clostridiales Family XIII bacterium]|jgi:excinuclease ABC subunit C|nr:excinuclease ABC subunit UvrC [Clostridiales Family XIII bacterium]
MFDIEENLKELPDKPGVYLHKDSYGEIIYVGKAASLKKRVRQYFRSHGAVDPKTATMVTHIAEFEYIVTRTEMEALLLENTLIKRWLPRYNVMLRDDKTYPYIKITMGEPYPRLLKTRILKNDGSKYFGPYADVSSVNRIIDLLRDIFRLKRCSHTEFPQGFRPCLNGHIDKCRGVCSGQADRDEYMKDIRSVVAFLKGGNREVIAYLKGRMKTAAEAMRYEEAAKYRDYITSALSVVEKQRVELLSSGNMDVILSTEPNDASVAQVTVFFVRDGRLVGREMHHLDAAAGSGKTEIVSAFLSQYYINQTIIPKEILLEAHIADEGLIEELLSKNLGGGVKLIVPERGKKRELLRLAQNDVDESVKRLDERLRAERERERELTDELCRVLCRTDTPSGPLRLEAYDISHTAGSGNVGAMVVFEGNKPIRSDYRRFKIRGEEKGDDYGSMQEMLYRRLKRGVALDKGFDRLPDLILVDGGAGHVRAAEQVTRALKLDLDVAGMVKDDRHRTRGLIFGNRETDLKATPTLFHLIGGIQEEVHRFAIDYHRGVRKSAAVRSQLDDIPGIGEKRRNALLARFGSIDAIKAAEEDEIGAVPGMNRSAAREVKAYFAGR